MHTTSLSSRVGPVTPATPPVRTGSERWRAATLEDVEAIAALCRALAAADHPDWAETPAEILEEFSHSWVNLPSDSLVAVAPDGQLLAYGLVELTPVRETLVRAILSGGVHPEHRGGGLGRQLLDWQYSRAREMLASCDDSLPGWLMVNVEERNRTALRLYERAGFFPARYFSQLERDLAETIPDIPSPADVSIVPFTAHLAEPVRVAKNSAFRDHWGAQPSDPEEWASLLSLPTLRPDLSFVAVADDAVVGFVVTQVYQDDWEAQGFRGSYIQLVGVLRGWRRRGVASSLLARALIAHRDAGLERAVLDVDSENPTGAFAMYTRMGFTGSRRSRCYLIAY